jgi:hypothetical protein
MGHHALALRQFLLDTRRQSDRKRHSANPFHAPPPGSRATAGNAGGGPARLAAPIGHC